VVNALPSAWTDADKKSVVEAFKARNYETIASLGEKDSIPGKVDSVLSAAKIVLPADKLMALKSALQAAAGAGAGAGGAGAGAGAVVVPPGGVDVTAKFPTLMAETAGSIETFTIPSFFKAADTPFVSPSKLEPWQWLYLASSNNLTTALSLEKLLDPKV